ncbi:MAG: hypothetical protein V4710_05150 [Verrucomicrobiota bacterium]
MALPLRIKQAGAGIAWFAASGVLAYSQLVAPSTPRPAGSSLLRPAAPLNPPPPREVPLVEKKFEALADQKVSEDGQKALGIDPAKWKHAETPNFILHYRRATEAQKVAREVEFNLWHVATALGATKERYQRRSHVYIFEDEQEWKQFLSLSGAPPWSISFAMGDELFLNVRREGGGSSFDSATLAHETSHAVVARIFPGERWPLWLNEGFAEYMGGASVAARKGQTIKRFQKNLQQAEMPLATLESLTEYPSDQARIGQLYQTSEKFIRFLMNELPKERIVPFIDAVVAGKGMRGALLQVYGDQFKDWPAFEKRYERFTK